MKIYIKLLIGEQLTLEVRRDETVIGLRRLIQEKEGIPSDQICLIYGGKALWDYAGSSGHPTTLIDFNISEEATIHMVLQLRSHAPDQSAELVSDSSAAESCRTWEAKAKKGDFDQDLHIVDPQSHFHLLKQLEQQVVARSEYRQAKGKYDIHEIFDPDITDQTDNSLPKLPSLLLAKLYARTPSWKVSAPCSFCRKVIPRFGQRSRGTQYGELTATGRP